MSENCLFCRISKGEIPSYKVYENNDAMAFLDINPLAPGQTVVIPKTHSETILDLPSNKVGPLFEAVQSTAQLLKEKLAPGGFTIGMNQGRVSGQSVPHLHILIIPRNQGDGGGSIHSVVHWSGGETVEEIIKKIKS